MISGLNEKTFLGFLRGILLLSGAISSTSLFLLLRNIFYDMSDDNLLPSIFI